MNMLERKGRKKKVKKKKVKKKKVYYVQIYPYIKSELQKMLNGENEMKNKKCGSLLYVRKTLSIIMHFFLVAIISSMVVYADEVDITYHSMEEIEQYFKQTEANYHRSLIKFDVQPSIKSPYEAGKLSDDTLRDALVTLNRARFIAGLQPVSLLDDYNQAAQAAVFVNAINNEMSHFPSRPKGIDDELYKLACMGAASSNLHYEYHDGDYFFSTAISGWLYDSDPSNIATLGHRRWLLNPYMKYTGFGAALGSDKTLYCSVIAHDSSNTDASEGMVKWPAQNMPIEFFHIGAMWSISTGQYEDVSSVTVYMQRKGDGKTWQFDNNTEEGLFNVNNEGCGQCGCISFRPDITDEMLMESLKWGGSYPDGDQYNVRITGLSCGEEVNYTVNFFSVNNNIELDKVKIKSLTNKKKQSMTLKWKKVKNADGYAMQYALNKKFSKNKKTKNTKKNSLTIKKLKKGKTYYVRVRAYKKNSFGKKVYGEWSKIKKVKIKK